MSKNALSRTNCTHISNHYSSRVNRDIYMPFEMISLLWYVVYIKSLIKVNLLILLLINEVPKGHSVGEFTIFEKAHTD